jgi:phosphoribosylformimino-5-aminoimidazole carboxamide ribotide isomerase
VRLLKGDFSRATRYSDDPVATARSFADAGARWLHIVDLDAAEGRGADNLAVVERVRGAVSCRIQAGGGVRDAAAADRLLGLGIDRIVVGTALVRRPADVMAWIRGREERFAAGLDAVDGVVRIAGWTEDAGRSDTEVAAGLSGLGIRWLVYTNISRDGTLAGPDLARTSAAADAAGVPTLLSGGISGAEDVAAVAGGAGRFVAGVILGRAVYESRVSLASLFRSFPQDRATGWDAPAA